MGGKEEEEEKKTAEINLLILLMLVGVQPRIKQKVLSPYQLTSD